MQHKVCCVLIIAYLGWTLKSMSQISQYLFIFLSQYCVQKCLVWIRPKCVNECTGKMQRKMRYFLPILKAVSFENTRLFVK